MINNVLFLGSKKLGYTVLEKMYSINQDKLSEIVTLDDSGDKRSYLERFKEFASFNGIKITILKGPVGFKDVIEKGKPDLVVVAGWYWIISKSLLSKVPGGFIGIHGSLLPNYRGFAPFVWALINGERRTGVSLFYFADGIDTGDIIDQKELKIGENTTIAELLEDAEEKSVELINDNYEALLKGKGKRTPQSELNVSYCSIRKPKDGNINWADDNTSIHNFIRAQSDPYPGAFSFIDGQKYFITKAKVVSDTYFGPQGVVAKKNKNSIVVCCGKNAIEVLELREEGSKENSVHKIGFGHTFTSKI